MREHGLNRVQAGCAGLALVCLWFDLPLHAWLSRPLCAPAATARSRTAMLAKKRGFGSPTKQRPAKKPAKGGFGTAPVKKAAPAGQHPAVRPGAAYNRATQAQLDYLVHMGRTLKGSKDPDAWFRWAAAAAEIKDYGEARMILQAGVHHIGMYNAGFLLDALGEMHRIGPTREIEAASKQVNWPGKGDESPYPAEEMRFVRLSAPEWPPDSPRGSPYTSGQGAVCLSTTPVIDPSECAWLVEQVEQKAGELWIVDHSDESMRGVDKVWNRKFPDRLWLRQIPGLLDWFEHRLRTRMFPMLQSLYPEAIPHPDALRCYDAFISRYEADGMKSLEVHQDTTDFTFTIALNPTSDYDGGGTIFPSLRAANKPADAPFEYTVVKPEVGCIAAFPGKLRHGGNEITRGVRYMIPLFIYLDGNYGSDRERGYLLQEAGIHPGPLFGLDAAAAARN